MRSFIVATFVIFLNACNPTNQPGSEKIPLSKDFATAELLSAAQELIEISPNGLAIGEVHGQLEGVRMLEAAVDAASKSYDSIVVLIEFTPEEVGLDIAQIPLSDFRIIDASDKSLSFWMKNSDKRATWELYDYLSKLTDKPDVEVSYFWDSRLNPPPNRLKAHGLAERWHIARTARPESYLIALAGNFHTKTSLEYPLNVTNSLCRYLDETHGYRPTCMTVDNMMASEKPCSPSVEAELIEGMVVFESWDYVVRRPDRCTRKAHWVEDTKAN